MLWHAWMVTIFYHLVFRSKGASSLVYAYTVASAEAILALMTLKGQCRISGQIPMVFREWSPGVARALYKTIFSGCAEINSSAPVLWKRPAHFALFSCGSWSGNVSIHFELTMVPSAVLKTVTGQSLFSEALPWSSISTFTAFETLILLPLLSVVSRFTKRLGRRAHMLPTIGNMIGSPIQTRSETLTLFAWATEGDYLAHMSPP